MARASFAKKVSNVVCAVGGSDINLIPYKIVQYRFEKNARIHVTKFETAKQFGLASQKNERGEEMFVTCDKQVMMNRELFIRHGCYLELRNVKWYVAMSDMSEPILGRPILEAFGIHTRDILAAAVDKVGSSVDLFDIDGLRKSPEGGVARIPNEGLYHRDRSTTGDAYEDEDEAWLDLVQDSKKEMDESISSALQKAEDNGISNKGKETLSCILNNYRDVLRMRLGNDSPELVDAMKVELKRDATPVAAKARRYTQDGRKFMERYVNRVIEYGFGEVTTEAKWVAAPVLVAKPPPALFRLTFDYRPINAATALITWPMPHIDSELTDLAGSKVFAVVDFVTGYWQIPLQKESQLLLSFMTTNKVVCPTRCTQRAKNAGTNFQSKVEPLFTEIRNALKALLDEFMLHSSTEKGLLEIL